MHACSDDTMVYPFPLQLFSPLQPLVAVLHSLKPLQLFEPKHLISPVSPLATAELIGAAVKAMAAAVAMAWESRVLLVIGNSLLVKLNGSVVRHYGVVA